MTKFEVVDLAHIHGIKKGKIGAVRNQSREENPEHCRGTICHHYGFYMGLCLLDKHSHFGSPCKGIGCEHLRLHDKQHNKKHGVIINVGDSYNWTWQTHKEYKRVILEITKNFIVYSDNGAEPVKEDRSKFMCHRRRWVK